MLTDVRGIAITTCAQSAVELMETATHAFLAQRADTGTRLQQMLDADPGLVLGHVLDGFCHLLAARRPAVTAAREAHGRAVASIAARGGTARERQMADALSAWAWQGEMTQSADLLDQLAEVCGLDVLALRLGHAVRFMLGDAAGMRRTLEIALPSWSDDTPLHAFVLGCHAFALGETGEVSRAEAVGRKAVALCPDDLWGGHAVAHALAGQRRPREAVAWIAWMEPHLTAGGAFARHLHWHRALGHLALGDRGSAMEVYRTLLRSGDLTEVRDMLNAASLLWRLQDVGLPVTNTMWDELADIAETRIGEHAWVFADLHYALCLAGAGRMEALARLSATMWHHATTAQGSQARVAAEVGLPVAHAIAGMAGGSSARAAELLRATSPDFAKLGGSIAQRAVLHRLRATAEEAAGFETARDTNYVGTGHAETGHSGTGAPAHAGT